MELDTTELARPEYRETQPLCAEEAFASSPRLKTTKLGIFSHSTIEKHVKTGDNVFSHKIGSSVGFAVIRSRRNPYQLLKNGVSNFKRSQWN
jgi:hypothetical protein